MCNYNFLLLHVWKYDSMRVWQNAHMSMMLRLQATSYLSGSEGLVEDLPHCGDPAVAEPECQVGGVNPQQGRGGQEVLVSLTHHTHLLSSLVTPPNLHVPQVQDGGEETENAGQLVTMETKQLQGFCCGPEF